MNIELCLFSQQLDLLCFFSFTFPQVFAQYTSHLTYNNRDPANVTSILSSTLDVIYSYLTDNEFAKSQVSTSVPCTFHDDQSHLAENQPEYSPSFGPTTMKDSLYHRLWRRECGEQSQYAGLRGIYGSREWVDNLDIVNELGGHTGCVNALRYACTRPGSYGQDHPPIGMC